MIIEAPPFDLEKSKFDYISYMVVLVTGDPNEMNPTISYCREEILKHPQKVLVLVKRGNYPQFCEKCCIENVGDVSRIEQNVVLWSRNNPKQKIIATQFRLCGEMYNVGLQKYSKTKILTRTTIKHISSNQPKQLLQQEQPMTFQRTVRKSILGKGIASAVAVTGLRENPNQRPGKISRTEQMSAKRKSWVGTMCNVGIQCDMGGDTVEDYANNGHLDFLERNICKTNKSPMLKVSQIPSRQTSASLSGPSTPVQRHSGFSGIFSRITRQRPISELGARPKTQNREKLRK